jgi:hypothetical protein
MANPHFKHDCDHCEFWGHWFGHDVYYCGGSIVARWGDDGPDYASSPLSVLVTEQEPGYAIEDSVRHVIMPYIEWLWKFGDDYRKAWYTALAFKGMEMLMEQKNA